jgi:putative hydrolase of the HAD superfamily
MLLSTGYDSQQGMVLIDFYGTLARSEEPRPTLGLVCHDLGIPISEENANMWSLEAADGIVHPTASLSPQRYRRWELSRYRRLLLSNGIDDLALALRIQTELTSRRQKSALHPVDKALSCLQEMRRAHLTVVVCSNWSWDLPEVLDHLGLGRWCQLIISSAEAGGRKPHPIIFDVAMRRARCKVRSRVVLIGDHPVADGVGGALFGLHSVHLIAGSNPSTTPDLLAKTFNSLKLASSLEEATIQAINELSS